MISWTKVLLPEPLTPETATSRRRGKAAERFFMLWQVAPLTWIHG